MKRLKLIGFSEQRSELLQQLLHMGCVEISEPDDKVTDPAWTALVRRDSSSLSDRKAEWSAVSGALDALKKYAPAKAGLFVKRADISESRFWDPQAKADALAVAEEINDCVREIARIYSTENKLNSTLAGLLPWCGLDLPLEQQSTHSTELVLGTTPAAAEEAILRSDLAQATDLAQLQAVSSDKDLRYWLLVVHKTAAETALTELRKHSFSVVRFKDVTGTAQSNADQLRTQQKALAEEREAQVAAIVALAPHRKELQVTLDRLNQELAREAVAERMLTNGSIFFAEGWVPADRAEDLSVMLKHFTCAWEAADPSEEDTVPTKLRNPKWMSCINMVTEMYSLPHYKGIDPNPLMFFWYVFFFGFMFADVAYGIIIFLVSLLVTKLYKPKKTMGRMFQLGMWLGGASALCGVFVGGFFGNALDVIYENFVPGGRAAMPGWMAAFSKGFIVNPVNDPMTVLIIAIVIGCIHLIMGQCIHIYLGFRDGAVKGGIDAMLDVVPWWVLFIGIGVFVLAGTPVGLLIGALALIATQGRHEGTLFKKLFGGVKSLYDITSWLGDVLSYARLMALMLAGSVIGQVFNTLGALPRNIIVFALVFAIGHVFNIGVNLIGTYVHAARLQYLEYFGKFYIEGGVPFRPLQYDTKYVDITSEEEI